MRADQAHQQELEHLWYIINFGSDKERGEVYNALRDCKIKQQEDRNESTENTA